MRTTRARDMSKDQASLSRIDCDWPVFAGPRCRPASVGRPAGLRPVGRALGELHRCLSTSMVPQNCGGSDRHTMLSYS